MSISPRSMLMSSCSANTVETVSQSRSFTSLVYVAHPFSSQQGKGEQAGNILASSTAQLRLEGGQEGHTPEMQQLLRSHAQI